MKLTTLTLAFALAAPTWSAPRALAADPFYLHDGDRVVFYGDSITSDGAYARFVEDYARTRFPGWDLRFYNAGVGGDTVRGGGAGDIHTRLERDVIALRPTVVTIMLGMNDGGYRPLEPKTLADFTDGYRAIAERLRAALPGARLFFIRTSPFDDVTRVPDFDPGYDEVLRRLGDAVQAIAGVEKAQTADFGTPVDDGLRAVWRHDRDLARQILPDRVHPGPSGHLLMGATLLRAWHAPSLVARVSLNAATAAVVYAQNASVSQLDAAEGRLSWTQSDLAVPLPVRFDTADADLAEKALADLEGLDAEPLTVTGLAPGYYELKIDDLGVGRFGTDELALGVNLARYDTPMRHQAYQVLWAVEAGQQMQKVRRQLLVAAASDPSLQKAAAVLAARDESDQAARSHLAAPLARRFSLTRVP